MRSLLAGSRAVEAIRLELKAELEGDRSWQRQTISVA
jgi:hypothetical protein